MQERLCARRRLILFINIRTLTCLRRDAAYYERDAANIIRTVASATQYLHSQGIVHRDLKPENLLFRGQEEDAELLIADFGLSKVIDESKFTVLTTTCGTPGYMAPEIFKKEGHGKPVDIWAIGVIAYFLLCGYTPFDRENNVDEARLSSLDILLLRTRHPKAGTRVGRSGPSVRPTTNSSQRNIGRASPKSVRHFLFSKLRRTTIS